MGLYGGGTNHMEEEEDTHQCLLSTVGGLWGKGKERERRRRRRRRKTKGMKCQCRDEGRRRKSGRMILLICEVNVRKLMATSSPSSSSLLLTCS